MENFDEKEKTDEGHQQEEGLVVQECFRQEHKGEQERKTVIAKECFQPWTKSEKSRSLNAKPPTRRNLSFKSKKQTTQTQSVDVSNTLGTLLEKKLHWEFDCFF